MFKQTSALLPWTRLVIRNVVLDYPVKVDVLQRPAGARPLLPMREAQPANGFVSALAVQSAAGASTVQRCHISTQLHLCSASIFFPASLAAEMNPFER
jgi:hypothetical protein